MLKHKTSINVQPHLFRHTHATVFYNETKDIKQVQERLGHSNIQTTINLYVHPTEEDIREDWNKVKHQFQVFNKKVSNIMTPSCEPPMIATQTTNTLSILKRTAANASKNEKGKTHNVRFNKHHFVYSQDSPDGKERKESYVLHCDYQKGS